MLYWRQDYFETLQRVETKARSYAEWGEYADFCAYLQRGLRAQAFQVLYQFIARLEASSLSVRCRFVSWLLYEVNRAAGEELLIPHPLRTRLVDPTLAEWATADPTCAEPHRWMGSYDHLHRALELDPGDQIARQKLVDCILTGVDYATHEMPFGYLGDPDRDWRALTEAEELTQGLPDEKTRQNLLQEVTEQRALVNTEIQRRKERH